MVDIPDNKDIQTRIPSAADMNHCPLCLKKWTIVEEEGKTGRAFFVCFEPKCMINIWVRDPMLGRWVYVEKEPCAVCGHKETRLFFRSDGYIKMVCPKCGCAIENVDPVKHEALIKREEAAGLRRTVREQNREQN